MTKVRDLTRPIEGEEKKLKPIEFVKFITDKGEWYQPDYEPKKWDFIDLICRNWRNTRLDLMLAQDAEKCASVIVLGHFNDGVTE
jgi:hypothetical protein